nr:response regulator [Brochothrix thermosphacta]
MKIAICDDDPALAEHVNDLLVQYDSTLFETFTYYGSKKLIQQIDTEKFDCYILDIEMDTINVMEYLPLWFAFHQLVITVLNIDNLLALNYIRLNTSVHSLN